MNLLGITWGMGARDVGMRAAVDSAQKNLNNLNDSLEQQSKIAGKSKMGDFFDKLRGKVRDFNIASIADNVQALTGDTGNLSNSLESMAASYAKSVKPIVAGMNLTGAAARKMTSRIAGMAIGMNVGAETVAEVFKTMQRATGPAKEALDASGMSARDWVKSAEALGFKAEEYTDITGGIGALFQVSAKDGAKFVNSMAELGKVTGLGLAPLKNLKGQTEEIGAIFEKMPPGLQRTGAEMTGLIQSATRMSGVFLQMGSSEEDAIKLGGDTAKMFAEQSVAIQRAMALGMGEGDLAEASPILKYLTGLGIGFEEARAIVDVGSRDTVQGMMAIQQAFQKYNVSGAQQQAMLSGLSEALGSSAAGLGYLAQSGDAGAAALDKMSKVTLTGKFGLKDLANQAFTTGRTLQESFDLAKEAFDTKIRAIARADVRALVGAKVGAFNEVAKEIKALGSDSTWGPLVKGMSLFKQMGIQGLLLQFGKTMGMDAKAASKMSVKFNLAFDTLKGLGQELEPVMSLLGKFGMPGLAIGGIAGFFMLDDAERAKIMKTIEPMWAMLQSALARAWDNFSKWFAVAWDKFGNWVSSNWEGWWNNKILPAIMGVVDWFTRPGGGGEKIMGALGDVFTKVWDKFGIGGVAAMAGLVTVATGQGGVIGDALGGAIGGAARLAVENIPWAQMFTPTGIIGAAVVAGLIGIGYLVDKEMDRIKGKIEGEEKKVKEVGNKFEMDLRAQVAGVERVSSVMAGVSEFRPEDRQKKFDELVRSGLIDPQKFARVQGMDTGALSGAMMQKMNEFREAELLLASQGTEAGIAPERTLLGMAAPEKIDAAMKKVQALSQLPVVQQQLQAVAGKGAQDIWATVSSIAAVYDKMSPERLGELAQKTAEITAMAGRAMGTGVIEEMSVMGDELYAGGQEMSSEFGAGISSAESMEAVGAAAAAVAEKQRGFFIGNSPPTEGPLAGEPGNNPMYWAGTGMMEQFALGITDSTQMVADAVTQLLDESIVATFDAYKAKMDEVRGKFDLLRSVAGSIIESMGGKIQTSVEVGGVQENLEENMKAMLALPGMAGVTMAILQEGAKARALLGKIADNTTKLAAGSAAVKPAAPELAS